MRYLPNALLAFACLAAAGLRGQALANASIAPYWAVAGKPVTLTVSGFSNLCQPHFAHPAAIVEAGAIHLEIMAENDPAALCVNDTLRYYQTEMQLPALAAGNYPVTLLQKPACAYTAPYCPFAYNPQPAGSLLITDSAKLDFAILPGKVAAGKAFDLRLTRKEWSCNIQFENLNSNVNGHALLLSYTVSPTTVDTGCPVPRIATGPLFRIAALPAGIYQVMAAPVIMCSGPGPCPLAALAPQLAGALTVGEPVTALGAGNTAPEEKGMNGSVASKASARNAGITGTHPGQAGVEWRGDRRGLDGRTAKNRGGRFDFRRGYESTLRVSVKKTPQEWLPPR